MHRISLSKLMQLIAVIACLFFVLKLVPFLGYSQIPFAAYGFVLALLIEKPNGGIASNLGCRWIATRFLVSALGMILTIAFFCWSSRWAIDKPEEELFMFYLPVEIAFISLSSLVVYAFVFVFIVIPMTQFQMREEVEAVSDSFSNTRKDELM